jgi:hypothetical protein
MRICGLLFLAGGVVCLAACQPAPPPAPPAGDYKASSTIREIMDGMVMPPADVLWSVLPPDNVPKNDEDWTRLRRQAITLLEASDLLLTPGRHVAKPDEKSKAPDAQMDPKAIEALISKDRESWKNFSYKMHDAVSVALKAIDEKKAMALSDAGNDLTTVCGDCHMKFWYPPAPAEKK